MPTFTRHCRTKAPLLGLFSLPVSAGIVSPYFTGRDTPNGLTKMAYKVMVGAFQNGGGGDIAVTAQFVNTSTHQNENSGLVIVPTTGVTDRDSLVAAGQAAILQYAIDSSISIVAGDIIWPYMKTAEIAALIAAAAPSSYETIVSQTGTSAPAVSGSLTPLNSYAAGTTFTWARTSAGVYTLTASAAVFNTAGKTAVILGPLNNLNGQYTAVITSSTVITITTAVQSLSVLGLLGFTATPTDAMMTKTAVQVLTYA